jgi:hypothetical protein
MESDVPRVVREAISFADVGEMARQGFGDMVKACVDVERGVMAIGGELHSDEEALLLEDGSALADVWGITSIPAHLGMGGSNSIP